MKSVFHSFLIICICAIYVEAILFNLPPNTQKCLKEDMQGNQLVVGEYVVSEVPGQKVDYVVSFHARILADYALKSLELRWKIRKDTSYRKRTSLRGESSASRPNSMTHSRFASPRKYRHVSCFEPAAPKRSNQWPSVPIADQRAVAHEVSLTTKKGAESKNYEGVSLFDNFNFLSN